MSKRLRPPAGVHQPPASPRIAGETRARVVQLEQRLEAPDGRRWCTVSAAGASPAAGAETSTLFPWAPFMVERLQVDLVEPASGETVWSLLRNGAVVASVTLPEGDTNAVAVLAAPVMFDERYGIGFAATGGTGGGAGVCVQARGWSAEPGISATLPFPDADPFAWVAANEPVSVEPSSSLNVGQIDPGFNVVANTDTRWFDTSGDTFGIVLQPGIYEAWAWCWFEEAGGGGGRRIAFHCEFGTDQSVPPCADAIASQYLSLTQVEVGGPLAVLTEGLLGVAVAQYFASALSCQSVNLYVRRVSALPSGMGGGGGEEL